MVDIITPWHDKGVFNRRGGDLPPKKASAPFDLATFADPDRLHFGVLLLDPRSSDVRREVRIAAAVEGKRPILEKSNRELRSQGISLEEVFEDEGRKRAARVILAFGNLSLEQRMDFLRRPDGDNTVLEILSPLRPDDMGYWHRVAQLSYAMPR